MTKKEAKSCIGTIEMLQRLAYNIHGVMDVIDADNCKKIIKALEQEPRKGHWIENAEEYYKAINEKGGGVNDNTPYFVDDIACSECLAKFCIVENEVERFDYCPNCGADMREVKDGDDGGENI